MKQAINLVNLLPPDLGPQRGLFKLSQVLKNLSILSFFIFLIIFATSLAFYLLASFELKDQTAKNEQLKQEVRALEQTESALVVLKDRLAKIGAVYDLSQAFLQKIKGMTVFLANLAPEIAVSEISLDAKGIEFSLRAESLAFLSSLFSQVYGSEVYKSAVLSSFSYNPSSGYSLVLILKEK